jgi:type IV pilus assembly protein PilO
MAIGDQFNASELAARMERLPLGVRLGVLAAVFAAVVGLYWFTVYGGQREELNRLEAELTKLQTKVAESRAVASNLKAFQKTREELEAQLAEALRRLPNGKELPVLLTDITSLGKKSGLEFRSFKPGNEVHRGFYAEVPIRIEVSGQYHEVGVFFDRLSRLSRIVNMGDLQMKIEKGQGESPDLSLKGVATTYRFKEGGGQSAGGE